MLRQVCTLLLLLVIYGHADEMDETIETDAFAKYNSRGVHFARSEQRNGNGESSGRNQPPAPYYMETPRQNGRVVFQIDQQARKIHEQLALLGPVLPQREGGDNGRRNQRPSSRRTVSS